MRIDLGIYSVLLAGGLGLAYWASLPKSDDSETKVSIISFDPASVKELAYVSEDITSKATRLADDKKFWVTLSKVDPKQNKPKDPKETPKEGEKPPEPTPPAPPKVETFLANEQMEELLTSLNPLQALRVIGKIENEKMAEEFGLKDSAQAFVVTSGDPKAPKKLEIKIGKKSYGSANRFVLNTQDNKVYLVDEGPFEKLRKADFRLFERRIVAFAFEEITRALIKVGEKEKAILHTKRDDKGALQWSDDQENANIKPIYRNWLDKVEKLKVIAYADPAQKTALESLQPFLEIKFEKDGTVIDTLTFKKLDPDPSIDTSKPEKDGKPPATLSYWIGSQFLQSYGKIGNNRIDVIEKDIPSVLE